MQARHREAAARWPGVELDLDAFADHVREKSTAAPVGELNTEHLYLALACARGDARALAHLERTFLARIDQVVRPLDTRADFADEVTQKLRERLLIGGRLLQYAGRGGLEAWINVGAIRTGLNLLRSERRRGRHEDATWSRVLAAADTGDPELEAFKADHRERFERALVDACGDLSERHRAVLRLHFVDGLSIDRIGVVYAVHRSTAARWIATARELLRDATRDRLTQDHGIPPSQASFVQRLVASQLAVSFSDLFGAEGS